MRKQNPDTKKMRKERKELYMKRFCENLQAEIYMMKLNCKSNFGETAYKFLLPTEDQSLFRKIKSFFRGVK